jgi:hypothetical protein
MRLVAAGNPRNNQLDRTLGSHRGLVNAVAFSADGSLAISGGGDGQVQVWDVATGKQQHCFQVAPRPVKEVGFSRDSLKAIAFPYEDGPPHAWDLATGQPFSGALPANDLTPSRYSSGFRASIRGLSPYVEKDDACRCWVVYLRDRGPDPVHKFVGLVGYPHASPMLSDDARWLITGGANRLVQVWDVDKEKAVQELTGHRQDVLCVAFSPRGEKGYHAISGGKDGEVRLWGSVAV